MVKKIVPIFLENRENNILKLGSKKMTTNKYRVKHSEKQKKNSSLIKIFWRNKLQLHEEYCVTKHKKKKKYIHVHNHIINLQKIKSNQITQETNSYVKNKKII